MPWPFCMLLTLYHWVTGPGTPIWRLLWNLLRIPSLRDLFINFSTPLIASQLESYLHSVQPDVVVSLHALTNHLGLDILRRSGLQVPFITVVVDLVSAHPFWFCPDVTQCIVATDTARRCALAAGLANEQIKILGHPVRRGFTDQVSSKYQIR